ncbi:MAG: protein-L-isoaspartate O-methyltransferase [Bryobacteraceae bacterium]
MIPNWAGERQRMVETQLRRRGLHDARVLEAMGAIPREEFVPLEWRVVAYGDSPVTIGYGQTISQPYMTALMAEALELDGTETVLEVGAGCGYAAAVLGALSKRVVSLEIIPELAEIARRNLRRTGRDGNIEVITADGSLGYRPLAPYDAISVPAGAPDVPAALLDQLQDPGRLVIPIGEMEDQELRVVCRQDGHTDYHVATLCRFVPLRGGEGWA